MITLSVGVLATSAKEQEQTGQGQPYCNPDWHGVPSWIPFHSGRSSTLLNNDHSSDASSAPDYCSREGGRCSRVVPPSTSFFDLLNSSTFLTYHFHTSFSTTNSEQCHPFTRYVTFLMLSPLCLRSHPGCPSDLLPRGAPTLTPFLLSSSTLAIQQQGYCTCPRRPNIHKVLASLLCLPLWLGGSSYQRQNLSTGTPTAPKRRREGPSPSPETRRTAGLLHWS